MYMKCSLAQPGHQPADQANLPVCIEEPLGHAGFKVFAAFISTAISFKTSPTAGGSGATPRCPRRSTDRSFCSPRRRIPEKVAPCHVKLRYETNRAGCGNWMFGAFLV